MNKFFTNTFAALLTACSMMSCALAQEVIFRDGFEEPAASPPLPGSIHVELLAGAPISITPLPNGTQVVLFEGVLKNTNTSQFNLIRMVFTIVALDGGGLPFGSLQIRFGSELFNPASICPNGSCVVFQPSGKIGLSGETVEYFQLLGGAFGGSGRRFVVKIVSSSDVGGTFISSTTLQVTGVPRSGPIITPQ